VLPRRSEGGHPLKGTSQEEKILRKQERAFSLGYDAAARMGCQLARRSSRYFIDSFGVRQGRP
jgi:hypothetical protein